MPEIINFYTKSPNVESLHLSRNQLNYQDAGLLTVALDETQIKGVSKIRILDLSRNEFGKEGAKIFATILPKNNTLQFLDLSNNKIGVRGAQEIAKNLQQNHSIQFLNIFNNLIGFDGAKAFGEMLKMNSTLQHIEFGHNRIRDKGLAELVKGITDEGSKSTMKILGLRMNFLTEGGISDFLKVIKTKKN